ncbi:VOC family protein [Actinocrispum wychmicini]|uniref:Glyoxalase-like domain-containing protein n=1 Tax=Actinocrispum wychmicini TaxID=1213861 RepID=A0A4R2IP54_9PSEU|nr:VOC family protein [Actinocrispum wychmicini]TCO46657.1 hypothetical protein EV192_11852 [Actinocrispum wychmicini]
MLVVEKRERGMVDFGHNGAVATLRDIIIDSRHPASLARFWAAILDDYEIAPYDEAELERLRGEGIDSPEDDPTVALVPGSGGPRIWFQLVPESKVVKNRVHLDIDGDHEPILALGATVSAEHDHWLTLLDPEGNEFCVFPLNTD